MDEPQDKMKELHMTRPSTRSHYNLWTTMLQDAGAQVDRFADANATASSIWA